jgi:hypothetical protein
MKFLFKYTIAILVWLSAEQCSSQTVIDISTGVWNNNNPNAPIQLIPYLFSDDTWLVSSPQPMYNLQQPNLSIPSQFFPAAVSNGVPLSSSCLLVQGPQPQLSNARWISTDINSASQYTDAPAGYYYYKMTFNYSRPCYQEGSCIDSKIKSATINLRKFYYDDFPVFILLNNNTPYFFSGQSTPNSMSFSIPPTHLNFGLNTLVLLLSNAGCREMPLPHEPGGLSPTGMQIEGDIVINDYTLTNLNGVDKTEFCLGEDVYFTGENLNSSSFSVDLFAQGGNAPLASVPNQAGSPAFLNLTDLLTSQPQNFSFQPNTTYEVRITLNTRCGAFTLRKQFTYTCCNTNSYASFNLSTSGGISLTGNSSYRGAHLWEVYTANNPATGPYMPMATFNSNNFTADIANNLSPCYLVRHSYTNLCGTECVSKSICNSNCENADCLIGKPGSITYEPLTQTITWTQLTGAVSYVVEVIKNGCCSNNQNASNFTTIDVPPGANSQVLNLFSPGEGSGIAGQCYLVKVYGICIDGSRSLPSTICIYP